MARPLSSSNGGINGHSLAAQFGLDSSQGAPETYSELGSLHAENAQLRQLCVDLEQALQEAAASTPDLSAIEERMREYDAILDQKDESIRHLHLQLQELQSAAESAGPNTPARRQGPLPAEDELLALSEQLESERRQLQEDEQALMEQMRQMEITMARERAEMARQRNDLHRLHGEIRHDLERLERNGAVQHKMEELKTRLQDAVTRRGVAPAGKPGSSAALPAVQPGQQQQPQASPRGSFMGRLFGGSNGEK